MMFKKALRNRSKILMFMTVLLFAGLMFAGCGDEPVEKDTKGTLAVGMPPWVNSPPQAYMTKVIIEDYLDYEVEVIEADIGMVYSSLVAGDLDYTTDVWLPAHEPYLEEHGDNIEVLSPFLTGLPLGLAVPEYVDIDSITELSEYSEEFNGKIIGIEPGAGIMELTENAMLEYGLEDWELIESSDYAMTAAIADAVAAEEWIVVTAWDPHWKFIEWDLKYLEDPNHVYIHPDELEDSLVAVGVRLGLREEAPEVVEFLDNWDLSIEAENELILKTAVEEMDPEEAVREWLEENPEKINEWLPQL